MVCCVYMYESMYIDLGVESGLHAGHTITHDASRTIACASERITKSRSH